MQSVGGGRIRKSHVSLFQMRKADFLLELQRKCGSNAAADESESGLILLCHSSGC